MSLSNRLNNYLKVTHADYRVLSHSPTESAEASARAAQLPESCVVKSVVLRDRDSGRYLLALTPAGNRLKMNWVSPTAKADLVMAREAELADLFPDCQMGAVPGFGQAYSLDVVWDDELDQAEHLYFEAGNHEELVEIDHDEFRQLFGTFPHAAISLPRESYSIYHADEVRGTVD